jgi:hypothetical protein
LHCPSYGSLNSSDALNALRVPSLRTKKLSSGDGDDKGAYVWTPP